MRFFRHTDCGRGHTGSPALVARLSTTRSTSSATERWTSSAARCLVGVAGAQLDAELVALRVLHWGDVVVAFDHGGAEGDEAVGLLVHGGEGAEDEVEPVGGGLGSR